MVKKKRKINKQSKLSREIKRALKESDDMIKNPNNYKVFNSVEKLFKDLDKKE